jgi:phosphatidylinositol alpha-mannosyltransferase
MKIGIVLPYSITKGGGVREYVFSIQAELLRRGHEAIIITPQPRGYEADPPKGVLFLGRSTDMKSPTHTTIQISASGDSDRIHEVLDQEHFDLIHFHEPWIPVLSRQILPRSNAINVATFHAKLPDTVMSKTIERVITPYTRSILKYIDVMTTVSGPASEYIRTLTDKKIHLVTNGIDLRRYKPGPLKNVMKEPTIFYVGRLEKRKGVKYLLQAFALVQQQLPKARLIIGGDGPDKKKLEQLADELGLRNVKFLGYIEDDEKIKYLQTCTVFCAPAVYGEAFGIVLVEALACGAPIVAGANPGYASALTGRGTLGLVNPYDAADFARRLVLHLEDPGIRAFWRQWSKEHIKQFDYRHIVDQYEEIYQEAAKVHRKHENRLRTR